jgi:hypothetical protein
LSYLERFSVYRCEHAATQHLVFVECADENIVFFPFQFFFGKTLSKGLAQDLMAQLNHLLIFSASMINLFDGHLKGF